MVLPTEVSMNSTGQQKGRTSNPASTGRVQPADPRSGAPKGTGQNMPPRKAWLWFVAVLVVNFFLARLLFPSAEGPLTVPYTLFKEEVAKDNVQAIYSRGDTMTGRFKAPVTYPVRRARGRPCWRKPWRVKQGCPSSR
jgi:cell division protease FtsH